MNPRITIYNMIINRVHARDTVNKMLNDNVEQAEDFHWKIQMKYHYIFHEPLTASEAEKDIVEKERKRT